MVYLHAAFSHHYDHFSPFLMPSRAIAVPQFPQTSAQKPLGWKGAYDRAAIKFRGVDADINFNVSDYDEDIKQVVSTEH
ncbi:unnamed protein product [Sphenostylis stenocarpa]|uniref:AP2/ERF domain-containing protein n=1 Tax=Sphenostylis stenocarpa TaxID=92480 RepID=A0AA87B8U5_9FABA|nr:unnamed protein product [Sphenostylis stenocarpa]